MYTPKFTVVLHAKEDGPDEYFSNQNEFVPKSRRGIWTNYKEAATAALRAATQDTVGRKATVLEF